MWEKVRETNHPGLPEASGILTTTGRIIFYNRLFMMKRNFWKIARGIVPNFIND
jgi:hypothetical protein